jgi:hypothetical protein
MPIGSQRELMKPGYVAGIVHRWDLRRRGLPDPGCPWRCPMAATIPSTSLVPVQPVYSDAKRLAFTDFLALIGFALRR